MALRGAIASLTQGGPYTVVRYEAGLLEQGYYRLGVPIVFDHTADVFTTDDPIAFDAEQPYRLTTSGTLPAGFSASTSYFVFEDSPGVYQLGTVADDEDTIITFADNGTGDARLVKYTALTVSGSLQPVTGRELRDLPEGQRGDEVRVLYTLTEIKTREPGYEPDTILLSGEPWTCIKVERFDAFGETHWRAYFARNVRA